MLTVTYYLSLLSSAYLTLSIKLLVYPFTFPAILMKVINAAMSLKDYNKEKEHMKYYPKRKKTLYMKWRSFVESVKIAFRIKN